MGASGADVVEKLFTPSLLSSLSSSSKKPDLFLPLFSSSTSSPWQEIPSRSSFEAISNIF
jgi:hypothetical protein